ncbi:MAG TPA: hypothetical protein VIN60_06655 [Anaerolineales bacterium]
MFYYDRLNDDYAIHQRNCSYPKDGLDVLVADAEAKRTSWYKGIMSHVGDALVSIGNSMKEHASEIKSTTLSPLAR